MRVVLLGPPGAGKGTQAQLLSKRLGVPHVSTGEILREEVAANSELGRQVKSILDSGNLVPDQLMLSIIKGRLGKTDCQKGFVLDGFPRTLPQARDLAALLKEIDREVTHVFELKVPEEILLERVRRRATQGVTRSDDNDQIVKNRLVIYREQTAPVSEFYRQNSGVIEVDGLGTVEEVNQRLAAEVAVEQD